MLVVSLTTQPRELLLEAIYWRTRVDEEVAPRFANYVG